MLHADVFIFHLFGLFLGGVQRAVQVAGDIDFVGIAAGAGHPGQRFHFLQRRLGESVGVCAQFRQQLGDQPVLLPGQGGQQVFLLYRLVGIFYRDALGVLQRFDGFLRQLVHVHSAYLLTVQIHAFFLLAAHGAKCFCTVRRLPFPKRGDLF